MQATVQQGKRIKGRREFVLLKRIKHTPYNPPNRTRKDNLIGLMNSLDTVGQLHPITISEDFVIVDGNRRFASAKFLGWDDIECNIVKTDDGELLYASVNSCARNMSGNDRLCVWLKNPHAVLSSSSRRFEMIVDRIGLDLLRRIAHEGYSVRVFDTARRIGKYCEEENLRPIVEWLLEFAVIGQVQKAIEAGESPRTIMEAVKRKRGIKFKLAIDE